MCLIIRFVHVNPPVSALLLLFRSLFGGPVTAALYRISVPSLFSLSAYAMVIFNFKRILSLIMAMNSLLVGFPLALLTV